MQRKIHRVEDNKCAHDKRQEPQGSEVGMQALGQLSEVQRLGLIR